jgi:hypothetical protein
LEHFTTNWCTDRKKARHLNCKVDVFITIKLQLHNKLQAAYMRLVVTEYEIYKFFSCYSKEWPGTSAADTSSVIKLFIAEIHTVVFWVMTL